MCLEDKYEEFKYEFHRVINSKDLKDIDDKKRDNDENVDVAKRNVDGTCKTPDLAEIGNVNMYLGMELVLNKGDEEGLHFERSEKRAVHENRKPIRKTW